MVFNQPYLLWYVGSTMGRYLADIGKSWLAQLASHGEIPCRLGVILVDPTGLTWGDSLYI